MSNANKNNAFNDFFNPNSWANNAETFGLDQFVAANRSNAETLAKAVKTISEGAQAVCRLQAEIAQESAAKITKAVNDISSENSSPEAKVASQAKLAKESFEQAQSNMEKICNTAAKYSNEANQIISKRVSEALGEFVSNTSSANKKKASSSASS